MASWWLPRGQLFVAKAPPHKLRNILEGSHSVEPSVEHSGAVVVTFFLSSFSVVVVVVVVTFLRQGRRHFVHCGFPYAVFCLLGTLICLLGICFAYWGFHLLVKFAL